MSKRGRSAGQLLAGVLVLLAVSLLQVQAQEQPPELYAIYKRGLELYLSGKYAETVPVAEEYIAVAAAKFGEDDPLYAKGLWYLGAIYLALNRLSEAEPVLKRALAITEKALGPDHTQVADIIGELTDRELLLSPYHAVYALLQEIDKDILLQASQCESVTNETLQLGRSEHARELGIRLKALSDRGWLVGEGTGRGKVYRFATDPLQEGLFDLFDKLEGRVPRSSGGSSAVSGEGSSASGEGLPPRLKEMADRIHHKKRPRRGEIESAVIALCSGRYLSFRELAALLGRTDAEKFRDRYIAPLVSARRLERRHVSLAHPNQAYKTAGT